MRKVWASVKASASTSLMAVAEARSWPIGFSTTTRHRSPLSPASRNWWQASLNSDGWMAR